MQDVTSPESRDWFGQEITQRSLELGLSQHPYIHGLRESPRPRYIDNEGNPSRILPDSGTLGSQIIQERRMVAGMGHGAGHIFGTTPLHKMLRNEIFGNKQLYGMLPGQFGQWYDHADEEAFARGLPTEEDRKEFYALQAQRNLRGFYDNPTVESLQMTAELAQKYFGKGESTIDVFLDDWQQKDWTPEQQYDRMSEDMKHILALHGYSPDDFAKNKNSWRFWEQMAVTVNLINAHQNIAQYNSEVGLLKNAAGKVGSALTNYLATDPTTVPTTIATIGWGTALKGGTMSAKAVIAATSKAARFGGNAVMAGVYSGGSSYQASKAWERIHGDPLYTGREIADHTVIGGALGGVLATLLTRDLGKLGASVKSRRDFMTDVVKANPDLKITDPAISTYIKTGKMLDPYTFQRMMSNESLFPLIETAAKEYLGPRSVRLLSTQLTLGWMEDNGVNAHTVLRFLESRPNDAELDRFLREAVDPNNQKWTFGSAPKGHVRWYEHADGSWSTDMPTKGRQISFFDVPEATSKKILKDVESATGRNRQSYQPFAESNNPLQDRLNMTAYASGSQYKGNKTKLYFETKEAAEEVADAPLFQSQVEAQKRAQYKNLNRQAYQAGIDRQLADTVSEGMRRQAKKKVVDDFVEANKDSLKKGYYEYQPEWKTAHKMADEQVRMLEVGGRAYEGDPNAAMRGIGKPDEHIFNWDEDSIAGLAEIEMHLFHEGVPVPARIAEKRAALEKRIKKIQDDQARDSAWNRISNETRGKFQEAKADSVEDVVESLKYSSGDRIVSLADMKDIVENHPLIRKQFLRDLHYSVEETVSLTGTGVFSYAVRQIPIIGEGLADFLFSAATWGTAMDATVASKLAPVAMISQIMGPGGMPGRNFLNRSYARQIDNLQNIKMRLDLMPQNLRRMWKALHDEGFVKKYYGGSTLAMNREISKMIHTGVIPENMPEAVVKYAQELRAMYDQLFKRAKASGLLKSYVDNYLPREWAKHKIARQYDEFVTDFSNVLYAKHAAADAQVNPDIAKFLGWVDEDGHWTDKAWKAVKEDHIPPKVKADRDSGLRVEGEEPVRIKADFEKTKVSMMTPEARKEYDELLHDWATLHAENTAKRMSGRHRDEVNVQGYVVSKDGTRVKTDADAVEHLHVSPYTDSTGTRRIDDDIYLNEDMAGWVQWEHLDVLDSYLQGTMFKAERQLLMDDITGMPGITWEQYLEFAKSEAFAVARQKGTHGFTEKQVKKSFQMIERAMQFLDGTFSANWDDIPNPFLRFGAAALHRAPNIFFGGWWGLNSLMVEVPWNATMLAYTSKEFGEEMKGLVGNMKKLDRDQLDMVAQAVEDIRVTTTRYYGDGGSDTLAVMNHVNQRARLKQGVRNIREAWEGDIDNIGLPPGLAAVEAGLRVTGDAVTTAGLLHTTTTLARRMAFQDAMMVGRNMMKRDAPGRLVALMQIHAKELSELTGRARVNRFNGLAREAGFGSRPEYAMRMNEYGLLDHNILKYVDEYKLFDPAEAVNAHSKLPSRVYDPEGYQHGIQAIERHRRFMEGQIDAGVPTPRIWELPKTDLAVHPLPSLLFKLGSFARKFFSANVYGRQTTPMARLFPIIAWYAVLDTMYSMTRTALTRDDITWEDLENEWIDDPFKTFAKYVGRTPWMGSSAIYQGDVLNLLMGTPYPVSFGGSASGGIATNLVGGAINALNPDKEVTESQKRLFTGQLPVILIKGLYDGLYSIYDAATDSR